MSGFILGGPFGPYFELFYRDKLLLKCKYKLTLYIKM